jgi:hypothetical protein
MFAVPPVFASGFCQVSRLRGGELRVGVESGGKTVRALRECPHLRIEIWGTRFCGSNLDVGHPPRGGVRLELMELLLVGSWRVALLDRERRTEQLHVVVTEESGVLKESVGGGDLREERLHLAGGREGDDQLAVAVADARPDVRDVAGGDDRVAMVEVEALATNLGDEFAFEDVEGFVLVRMDVKGWAAALMHVMLDHEEIAVAVLGEDFEGHGTVAHGVHLAGAVAIGEDGGNRLL